MEESADAAEILARLRFRWPWRPYQVRILAAVEEHAKDRRLHIVAAPGAGKTVLGLEIVRRFSQPALILSPTLTIRDQWIARLRDFLSDARAGDPEWVSTSLDDLGVVTSATYQSLHTRHRAGGAPSVDVDRPPRLRQELLALTLKHLFRVAAAAFVSGFAMVLDSGPRMREWNDFLVVLAIASAIGAAYAAVRVHTMPDERVSVGLEGGTFYERSLFADAFAVILEPIVNPRYLITREGASSHGTGRAGGCS